MSRNEVADLEKRARITLTLGDGEFSRDRVAGYTQRL